MRGCAPFAFSPRIAEYYLRGAPAAPAVPAVPPVAVGLPGFRVRIPEFHVGSPMVTLLQFDSIRRRIFVGDASPGRSTLNILDGNGHLSSSLPIPSPLSHLDVRGDTMRAVFMGQLSSSDAPRGEVALIPSWLPGHNPTVAWEVHDLQRPVFASWADLNRDGIEDVVVSEFGNLTGQLTWYERLANGGNRRHLLTTQPGAITTLVRDFDGDGTLDILALTAQGDEGISLFHGTPRNTFSPCQAPIRQLRGTSTATATSTSRRSRSSRTTPRERRCRSFTSRTSGT